MTGLIAIGFVSATVVALVIVVRRLGKSKSMVLATKTDAVRARALAEAAERTADRITGVAENALDVAGEIHNVSRKVDTLLDHATGEQPGRGRHALRAVPDSGEGYVA